MAVESIAIGSTITLIPLTHVFVQDSMLLPFSIAIDCMHFILYYINNQIETSPITFKAIDIETNRIIIHEYMTVIFILNELYWFNFFKTIIFYQLETNKDITT